MLNGRKTYDDYFKDRDRENNTTTQSDPSPTSTMFARNTSGVLGVNTNYGKSVYDKDLNWGADINAEDVEGSINENRAQKQSALAQLGAGLGRTAVKAAVETSKLPGIIGGLVKGTIGQIDDQITGEDNTKFIDTVFNNGWIKGLDNINEDIKSEYLPVYVKKAVQDGDLGDKIMSSAFWATDGADGAGFALGMILPGALLGKLGLGAKMIGAANRIDKARELFSGAERAEQFVKAANKIGATARNIDSGISIGYNTAAEAGAEAAQAGTETRANKGKIVDGWKSSGYLNTQGYRDEATKYIQSLDLKRRNGTLTIQEQNALTSDPLKVQEAVLNQRFENEVTSMQSSVFGRNVAILLGPNTLMHMQLFGRVGRSAEKIAEKGAVNTVESAAKREAANLGKVAVEDSVLKSPNFLKKVISSRIGKAVTKFGETAVKNTLSEGLWEEGLQTTTANQFKKYVTENRAEEIGFEDTIPDTFREYAKMLGTTEGQVSVMLGGVLGTGMTSLSAHSNAKEEAKIKNEITSRLSVPMNNLNNIFTIGDIYKKDENGSIVYKKDELGNPTTEPEIDLIKSQEILRSLILNDDKLERYKEAVDNGDNSYLDEQQNNAIFQLAKTAAYNGEKGLSLLQEQLDANKELKDIQERDNNNDGSKKTYDQIVKETMDTAKFLQKQNDKFQDFSETIIKLNDDRLTDPKTAKTYRTAFLNELNSRYLKVQNKLRFNNARLEELKTKRSNVLSELGFNTNLVTEDETLLKYEEDNPLLKSVNDEVRKIEEAILKNNKDISEVWKGNNVEQSFSEFVGDYLEANEQSSESKEEDHQNVINNINSFEDKESLKDYVRGLDSEFRDNSFIQDEIKDRYSYISEQERIAKNLKDIEDLETDKENFETDKYVESNKTNEDTDTALDKDNVNGLETVSTSDNKEVDENYENFDEDPSRQNNLDDSTNPSKIAKNQGAARIISTNQKTGEALPGLEAFVEFEKIPRDKTNDKVTFSLGDVNPKNQTFTANAILDRVKNGETLTEEEINYLASYLPIKVTIANGKDSASSFIDSMTSKSSKIVEVETLPLRKSIVKALVTNKGSFKSIEGKVAKQFTGTLKLGEQNSSVLELDVFKNMSPEEKIQYFKKNTVYVSNKGEIKYCASGLTDETTSLSSSNKGEVFLKIPMINGKSFYLKLNTARLSNEKAQDVLSLIILKSNLLKGNSEFSMEDLESYIESDLPFVKKEFEFIKRNNDSIDVNLDRLINFIVFSQNTNAKTKLILGPNGTLVLGELLHKVNAQIPEWSGQLESYVYNNDTLNNLNEDQKDAIVKYLQYKRHNVLITKDNTATFNNDDYIDYLLGIGSDYAVLTTNAVVNEPTFEGYSNIYLNQAVVDKNTKKVVPAEETEEVDLDNPEDLLASLIGNYGGIETETIEIAQPMAPPAVVAQQDIDAKKADIEKRRQEDIESLEVKGDGRIVSGNTEYEFTYTDVNGEQRVKVSLKSNTSSGFIFSKALSQDFKSREEAKEFIDSIVKPKLIEKINAKYNAELAALETPVSDKKAEADKLTPIEQNFADGTGGRKMQPQFAGKSTMDLILSGDRTRTTRANTDIQRMLKDYGLAKIENLVGKVIRMTDKQGRTAYTEITKVAPFTKEYQDATWQQEGWEKSVTDKLVGQYPYAIEFKLAALESAPKTSISDNKIKLDKIKTLENKLSVMSAPASGEFKDYPADYFQYLNLIFRPDFKGNTSEQFDLYSLKGQIYPGELFDPSFKKVIDAVKNTNQYKGTIDILSKYNISNTEVKTNEQKVAEYRADEKVENAEIEKRKEEDIKDLWKDVNLMKSVKTPEEAQYVMETLAGTHDVNDYLKVWNNSKDIAGIDLSYTQDKLLQIKDMINGLTAKLIKYKYEDKINAKYDAELSKVYDRYDKLISPLLLEDKAQENIGKEITAVAPFNKGNITGKIVSVVENKAKKGLYSITLDNGEKVSGRFEDNKFTWIQNEKEVSKEKTVKTIKSTNLQEVFKTADAKTKAKIVTVIAKQLGLMDKVNPKDMNSSFNELYKNLKDDESLEKEIKKICGI